MAFFVVRRLKNTKNRVSKSDVIILTWLLDHCKVTSTGVALEFCTLVVLAWFYNMYSVF